MIATTSISIAVGVIAFSKSISAIAQRLTLVGSKNETLLFVKIIYVCAMNLSAFFNFTWSARYINHATLLLMFPKSDRKIDKASHSLTVDTSIAERTLNRGYFHYTLGHRSLYFMFPVAAWIFGPVFLVITTVILIVFLFFLDHAKIPSIFNFSKGQDQQIASPAVDVASVTLEKK